MNDWNYPEIIKLGEFPSNSKISFLMNIETASECEVISKLPFLDIFPKRLLKGENVISLILSPLGDNVCIFGEIELKSEETKRIMLNGKSKSLPNGYYDNKVVFDATGRFERIKNLPINKLFKGQNVSVSNLESKEINVKLDWLSNLQELDVETFTFILDDDFSVETKDDFIFFGNTETNSVKFEKSLQTVTLKLNEIKENASKIIIAYNLYKSQESFKKIHLPEIKIIVDNIEYYTFSLSLSDCQTAIGLEFYRSKNGWRLNAIGAAYDLPFETLCAECGITANG
jgi:stress response protein SCP2